MNNPIALGLFSPRKAKTGSELPSARLISTTLISNADIVRTDVSLLFMVFGQFVDHDLDLTPNFVMSKWIIKALFLRLLLRANMLLCT